MKFSYRIITIVLLVCTTSVVYVCWDEDWMMWSRSKFQPTKLLDRNLYFAQNHDVTGKTVILSEDECWFENSSRAQTDIDTSDIFQIIDKKASKKKERHISVQQSVPGQDINFATNKLPLKIILVPHSHNDPGWHKTINGYFEDQTKPTLDNMVEKLSKFPNMTFVWAESVFLQMWYEDLDFGRQQKVKELIKRGQLEIVVGSWVVPDEANPHFFALIDQMIEGHQWLEKHIGVKPRNTWTLDPFGYSSTLPYLYKRAGYENMIILRVHEQLKQHLQDKKSLEFFWRQRWDTKRSTDIFTQMMPYKLYNIKHTCGPDHHICLQFDFRKIPGEWSESRSEPITNHNVERYAKLLLGQYQKKANLFRHNVVLVPLGDDFRYDRTVEWDQQYKNYMVLFNYINRRKDWNIQAQFGTLQDYFDEVKRTVSGNPALKEAGFPSLQGDFFPYTDENSEYWSGYFTTRPYDKMFGREVEVHLRAAEILNTLAYGSSLKAKEVFFDYDQNMEILPTARQSLGLFQHHDAITGTARSFVVIDYEQRLQTALDITKKVMTSAVSYLVRTPKQALNSAPPLSIYNLHPDHHMLTFINNRQLSVVLFNSIARERKELIQLTVPSDRMEVFDENGKLIPSQVNPIWKTYYEMSETEFELVFYAKLPALSLVSYQLVTTTQPSNFAAYVRLYNAPEYRLLSRLRFNLMPASGEHIIIENGAYRARFSPRTGLLHSVTTKSKILTTETNLEFLMYKSRGSGAYIFNPAGPAVDNEMSARPVIRVIRGPLVSEIHIMQELIQSRIRLYNTTGFQGQTIEIENIVDLRKKNDKELIMRLSTDIKHNATFYTDLNAFHVVKRQRFANLPPESNYYPMSAFAYIEDHHRRLSFISAQPLGVSSQMDGSLEIMLDRRLQYDDNRGLGEGVHDNKATPSRFYLLIEPKEKPFPDSELPSMLAHTLANSLRNYVFVMYTSENVSVPTYQPLVQAFPCDIDLTNLRAINNNSAALIIHRVGYHCGFPTTNLQCSTTNGNLFDQSMFQSMNIKAIQPTTLSLMHNVSRQHKIEPMEISTFRIYL